MLTANETSEKRQCQEHATSNYIFWLQPALSRPSPHLLVGPDRLSNYAPPVFVMLLIKVLYVKQDQPCGQALCYFFSLMALSSSTGNYCSFMSGICPVFAMNISWATSQDYLESIKKNQHGMQAEVRQKRPNGINNVH